MVIVTIRHSHDKQAKGLQACRVQEHSVSTKEVLILRLLAGQEFKVEFISENEFTIICSTDKRENHLIISRGDKSSKTLNSHL